MISLDEIEPLRARGRPKNVSRFVAMFREGKSVPPIALIKQRRGSRFRYRIADGAHRFRAAQRVGLSRIAAVVIAAD
jgi:hypothetical protein